MLTDLKSYTAPPAEAAEIKAAETLLLQAPSEICDYNYGKVNALAVTDHREEIPFSVMSAIIDSLASAKNVEYDNSYSKRGIFSIFFNLERKWERIDRQLFTKQGIVDKVTETFLDTCVDLAAYAVKLCAWICARRPDLYLKLLKTTYQESVDAGTIQKSTKHTY